MNEKLREANVKCWTLWEVDGTLWELEKTLGTDETREGIALCREALRAMITNHQAYRETLRNGEER